jgi:hypothetical protein
MAERARARLARETVARPAEVALRHCLIGSIACAKIAGTQIACTQIVGTKIAPGESVGTAGMETAAVEAARRAAAHPEATPVRRRRMKAAARMEAATAHPHATATHVDAATAHVEAATATTHVKATTAAAVESTTAAVSATTAPVSAPTAAMPGGRRIGRQSSHHGHARQKSEGKLVSHVVLLQRPPCHMRQGHRSTTKTVRG